VKWVELIREKSQSIQLGNVEFIKRFEPQVKEFRDNFNHSVSNSFASEWLSRWLTVANEDVRAPEILLPKTCELNNLLRAKLGSEVWRSEWHTVTQESIDQFANVTGDAQWLHTDMDRARKESPFKSTIAHGLLILSLVPTLRSFEKDETLGEARFIVNQGVDHVKFLAPVKPNQAIRLRSYLRRVNPSKRSIEIEEDILIELEHSLRQVCTATVQMKIYL